MSGIRMDRFSELQPESLSEVEQDTRTVDFKKILGFQVRTSEQLRTKIEAGFAYSSLLHFQKHAAISLNDLASLVSITSRTLSRRKSQGRLQPDESDRLVRIARLFALANGLFEGDSDAARVWLQTPKRALGGHTPLEYARTELGAREVESLIGRLEHGVYS
jgi:putative toxin-antitoxin system antitoxin component (TIGR02293 family)